MGTSGVWRLGPGRAGVVEAKLTLGLHHGNAREPVMAP